MPRLKRNLNVLGVIGNTRSFVELPDFSNNRELGPKFGECMSKGENERQ
jgi:hypothetical protein